LLGVHAHLSSQMNVVFRRALVLITSGAFAFHGRNGRKRCLRNVVWAVIWLGERGRARRSNLVIMQRDLDAKTHGYSAKSYIEALTKDLLPH
jgi:hypothetical protein